MKKTFLPLIIIGAVLFTACEKALDLPPADEISNDQYWKTVQDLDAYVVQFYASFPRFENGAGGYTGPIGADAQLGSDFQIRSIPVTQLNGSRSKVNSANNTNWNFVNIRSVNIFFENYQRVNDSWSNIQHYVGEAHFFKAWYYFNLVRVYGDVPWYTNSMYTDDPGLYNPRTPRTQVVDSILLHLDSAIADLKLLNDAPGKSNRLSKEAALIFKSRVALFEGSWQKYHAGDPFGTAGADPNKYFQACVDAVTELLTPGKYGAGIANSYSTLFNQTNYSGNPEAVLWRKYDKALTLAHNFQQFITSSTDEVSVTLQQVQHFLKADGTPYDYKGIAATVKGTAFLTKIAEECDPRLKQIIWIPGQNMWANTAGTFNFVRPSLNLTGQDKNYTGFQMSKGANPSDPTAGAAQGFSTSCETGNIVFRYAEALLNLAEAQAELGLPVDYNSTINKLRSRAGMPNFTVQTDPYRNSYADFGYTLTDELYEIRRERAVELACEGFRYDDWRRWAAGDLFDGKRPLGFPYLGSDYPAGTVVPTNSDGFVDPYAAALPAGYNFNADRDYLDCIPQNEITLNPALSQNPGW